MALYDTPCVLRALYVEWAIPLSWETQQTRLWEHSMMPVLRVIKGGCSATGTRVEKMTDEQGNEFEVTVSTSPFQGEHEPGEPGIYTFEEWEALHPERFAATE